MDISPERKQAIARLARLGFEPYKALLVAGFSIEEAEALVADASMQQLFEREYAMEEQKLLQYLDSLIDANAARGVSTELRFKLSKLSPERWGVKRDAPDAPTFPGVIQVVRASEAMSEYTEEGQDDSSF